MKIIEPYVEILDYLDYEEILRKIEKIGRVCYKSENKITEDSAEKFISAIIKRGHESVLEHVSITVKFIIDRGISHEIVRHRIASYSQESTRYCNYSKGQFKGEITVIKPLYLEENTIGYDTWKKACEGTEKAYLELLDNGHSPEQSRAVLPTSLKTELVMTANIREWRHFLKLRTSATAHPQMREVANILLNEFKISLPIFFKDIKEEVKNER